MYPSRLVPDDHFLSATNPLATADQRDLEAVALRVLRMPAVVQGRQAAAGKWKTIVGRQATPEAMTRFDELVEEWTFNYVLKSVNADANYPKILAGVYGPPHEWFGRKVPGSRASGGDGPDNVYAFLPIDFGGRYEITGQRLAPATADVTFTLTGSIAFTMTLNSLEGRDVEVDSDGRFTITLDPSPANGRKNHIQTKPNARYVFIRESRADWREVPAALRVRRLDPPTASPLTEEQIAERAQQFMIDDVPALYWFMRIFDGMETNIITPPFGTGAIGGLVSQQISFAHLKLADDEAFVVTMGPGGAAFRDLVLHDFWFRTIDYPHHTSTMNNAQGIPNADGTTTYVISIQDPGVHNWLDPVGLHELLVVHRWQGLPRQMAPGTEPTAKGELIKLAELANHLPPSMKRVTPAERKQQLDERLATFLLRFVDR